MRSHLQILFFTGLAALGLSAATAAAQEGRLATRVGAAPSFSRPAQPMALQRGSLVRTQRGAIVGARPTNAIALTANECVGLGGKVTSYSECASGSFCVTEDRDGVLKGSCIDEVSE